MAKLTTIQLNSLTPTSHGDYLYEDGNIRGKVQANKSGVTVAFSFRYRFNNNMKEIRLGCFPRHSLKDIRINRQKAVDLLNNGKDPALEKKLIKEQNRQEQEKLKSQLEADKQRITVNELFEKWKESDLVKRKDNGKEVVRMFEKDVLSLIGKMPVEEVKKAHIYYVIETVLSRGVNRMAKLLLSLMRQMFRFAQDRDIIENDPTSSIRKAKVGGKDTIRDRFLSDSEVTKLSNKLPDAKLLKTSECALWIILSTCCRIGEICKAKWIDLNLNAKTWKIPIGNSKNGKSHIIYLSDFAIIQFKTLLALKASDEWIFPNTKNTNHVCVKSITKQVGDRQLTDDKKPMSKRSKSSITLNLADGKWTPHDLRRTASTMMGNLGVRSDVIEKCLNHIEPNKMKRTYQHQTLDAEQKEAWNILGIKLEKLTTPSNKLS